MTEPEYGIAVCEYGVPVRVNRDGSMLTTCRECQQRIKAIEAEAASEPHGADD